MGIADRMLHLLDESGAKTKLDPKQAEYLGIVGNKVDSYNAYYLSKALKIVTDLEQGEELELMRDWGFTDLHKETMALVTKSKQALEDLSKHLRDIHLGRKQ